MQRPDYEALRCDILYPEIDRIIKARDVNNLSHENLKNLLKNIHYSYQCEADEAMYDDILENGSSFRRARSYANGGYSNGSYSSNGGVIHTPRAFSYSTGSYANSNGGNNASYGYNQRSGHTEEEMFMEELRAMMAEAKSPKVKEAIQETMQGMMR